MNYASEKFSLQIVIFLFFVLMSHSKKKKQQQKIVNDGEDIDADIFCKNYSRLIRMEKTDEIFMVDTTINQSVLLQCKYCEEKDNGLPKIWSKQRLIFTGNITELKTDMNSNTSTSSIFITKEHSLIIRNLQEKDLGLYICKAPYIDTPDKSFNYLIDLSNQSTYDIKGPVSELKNYTQTYLAPVNQLISNQTFTVNEITVKMKVYTDWTDWSDCDSCFRKEGVRFRLGRCRIKPVCPDSKECLEKRKKFKSFVFNDKQNTEKPSEVDREVISAASVEENIMEFGIALSCSSLLLMTLTPDLYNVTSTIPNFILSEKCKGICKGMTTKKGPRYRKSIILAKGAHLTLVCPDSSVDSDIRWEHNKLRLYPNEGVDYIPGTIEARLYVDSFNTLYLIEVTEKEAGNYTCFVNGMRMQEVKILVLARSGFFTKEFFRHLKYLGFVFLLCFIAYVGGVITVCVKSYSDKRKRTKKTSDAERLLKDRKKKKKYKKNKKKKSESSTDASTGTSLTDTSYDSS